MNNESTASLKVYVRPNASRDRIVGLEGNALRVCISAPPVEGKANSKLIELLSKILDIPKSSISIRSGISSKYKLVKIDNLSLSQIKERIEGYLRENVR